MSQDDIHHGAGQEGDWVERADDIAAAKDISPDAARGTGIVDRFRAADLVADVTLAQGVTYTPAGLRVLRTSYVFKLNQTVHGNQEGDYVTIQDTGGVYADGSSVSTENSFKLSPGGRYLVFADRVESDLWLRQVFELHQDGEVMSDAAGRLLMGIREGAAVVQPGATYEPLRYVRALPRPVEAMEDPPDESRPPPDPPESRAAEATSPASMSVQSVMDYLRTAESERTSFEEPPSASHGEGRSQGTRSPARQPPDNTEGGSDSAGSVRASEGPARAVLSGSHVTAFQSHFHFMPNDDNWAWTSHCRGSWNALVNNRLGLFAYKITTVDNQPIRNRLPVAGNNQNNVGVLSNAQMTSGGYDTWPVLSANGVCYTWADSNNRVSETDILINPAIAGDEAQFRKSLTHEFGHALTLDHETARMALLYPGTFRQPPNYGSLWYSRRDDHEGVRAMLNWVNANVQAGTWDVTRFTDMATWSQAHDGPGSAGNLVMTRLSAETVNRGDTVTVQFVHVENRGNLPGRNVKLKFYLSTNEVISSSDHEIGSFTWGTFNTWWSGSLNLRIPTSVAPGRYFFGWILTTDSAERSSSNNTAILMRDHNSQFAKVLVTIN